MANGKLVESNIVKYLGRLSELIRIFNAGNDYGINEYSENIVAKVMSMALKIKLKNANYLEDRLTEGIDLVSIDDSKISVQVSSTYKIDKIHDSISKYFKYGWYREYENLYIYMLVGKQKSGYSEKAIKKTIDTSIEKLIEANEIKNKSEVKFSYEDNFKVLDSTDIFKAIKGLTFEEQEILESYLSKQLSDEKLSRDTLRILHLKGFLFEEKKKEFYDELTNSLIKNLKEQEKIDLVCFSGDFVKDGSNKNSAFSAKGFLEKISTDLGIERENFAVCAGDFDLDFSQEQESINEYFNKNILNNKAVEKLIKENELDFSTSKNCLKNINSVIRSFYNNNSDVEVTDLYVLNKLIIGENKIGIVSLNSSWRTKKDGVEKLLFPISVLEELVDKIKDCSCKILQLHHPLNYFSRYNFIELQRIIYSKFDVILSGKEDKSEIDKYYLSQKGILAHVPCRSVGDYTQSKFGYSIINIDIKNKNVCIQDFVAKKQDLNFIEEDFQKVDLPCGKEKEERNKFTLKISEKYDVELESASELLLNYSAESNKGFLDSFSSPVLSTESKTVAEIKDQKKKKVPIENLYVFKKNHLIYGYDKCGKTSLLKRILLRHLDLYVYEGIIPFYLDFKELEHRQDEKNIILKEIKTYFSLSHRKAENLVAHKKMRLLIDNFDADSNITKALISFLRKYPKVGFIICAEQSLSRIIEHVDLGENTMYDVLYLHDLTRKEIRSYSSNWNIYTENREETINGVIRLCRQLKLPLNYWTVSLLFMIHKKTSDNAQKNIFEILTLAIDEMLDKKKIFLQKNQITFDQLKTLCGHLAYFLLTEHQGGGYRADYDSVYTFISNYVKDNKRVTASPKKLIDYLLKAGILKATSDDYYTFRLNGIFEYFLAWHMVIDSGFREKVLEHDNIYLSFSNELELYSGFNNRDEEFVKVILNKTKAAFQDIYTKERENEVLDIKLRKKQRDIQEIVKAIKDMDALDAIPVEMQDEIMDEVDPIAIDGDVQEKKIRDNLELSVDVLEKYLTILSRVFKNSNGLRNDDFVDEMFNFILKAYAHFGFYVIDEVEDNLREKDLFENASGSHMLLLKLVSNFIPVYIQSILYDGVGHFTMTNMVKDKIKELENDSSNNQYELFLLYFVLLDIDLKENKSTVKKVVKNIKIGTLKISAFIKLNYYRTFKVKKDEELGRYLKKQLRELQFKINPKTKDYTVDKFLEATIHGDKNTDF